MKVDGICQYSEGARQNQCKPNRAPRDATVVSGVVWPNVVWPNVVWPNALCWGDLRLRLNFLYRHRWQSHGCDKAIPTPGDRLHKSGIVGRITQRCAQLSNCRVQAVVEFDKCVIRPQLLLNFFPGDDLAWPFEQKGQNAKWLALDLDPQATFRENSVSKIGLVSAEPDNAFLQRAAFHKLLCPQVERIVTRACSEVCLTYMNSAT
jgi:hypothetical protein